MLKVRKGLRVALSLAIFTLVLNAVGMRAVVDAFRGMSPEYFIAALVLIVIDSLIRGTNWYQILRRFRDLSYQQACLTYLTGAFYGSLLPATVGTDAARAVSISRRASLDIRVSVGSLVTLNLVGLNAVTALGAVATVILLVSEQSRFLILDLAFSAPVAIGLGIALFTSLGRRLIELLSRTTRAWTTAHRVLEPLLDATLVLPTEKRGKFLLAAVAVASQLIRVTVATLVATSLGIEIHWLVFAAIAPLVAIVAMVPLSVLGFGLEQGAMVFLLSYFGIAGSDAFAISLTLSSVQICLALVAGIVVILDTALSPRADEAG